LRQISLRGEKHEYNFVVVQDAEGNSLFHEAILSLFQGWLPIARDHFDVLSEF